MRLWQRLFLVIAGVGSVAVLAVLLAQQQAFRRGFVDYLNTLEAQRIEEIRDRLVAYYRDDPQRFIQSLVDNLGVQRLEVDMLKFSGPAFANVDNRLMSLYLVQFGLTNAVMFGPDGEV